MKRRGFTLAEVLITLGIIGVVAALTAPALVQNAGSAQIGPKLAKAVSTFETANENLLTVEGASRITTIASGANRILQLRDYGDKLANYMKMSFLEMGGLQRVRYGLVSGQSEAVVRNYNGDSVNILQVAQPIQMGVKYLSKDGFLYVITLANQENEENLPPHQRTAGQVVIDINGLAEPNRIGKDVFAFTLREDGTLSPLGSLSNDINGTYYWKDGSKDQCNEDTVTTGASCAGSIFENNLKVIYQ